jgi:hypothetical protein
MLVGKGAESSCRAWPDLEAGLEERRFGVFRGSDAHMQHTKYFAAIMDQMKQPGAMEGPAQSAENEDEAGGRQNRTVIPTWLG